MARGTGFGTINELPSGRYRARYYGPDGKRHSAPATFRIKAQAKAWLSAEHTLIARGEWTPPAERAAAVRMDKNAPTLEEYAATWIASRRSKTTGRPLAPKTREHYTRNLLPHIVEEFGSRRMDTLTTPEIAVWFRGLLPHTTTTRAHVYTLFRSILASAVSDGLIATNPCKIDGAGVAKTTHHTKVASVGDIAAITKRLPEQWQAIVILGGWMALRFGEATALVREDVDLTTNTLHIRRGVVYLRPEDDEQRGKANRVVGNTKSHAGARDLPIPAHVVPVLAEHLRNHVGPRPNSLLFHAVNDETKHVAYSTFMRHFYAAREDASRPDLRFHDLRHTAGTMLAQQGATLRELMDILGQSTTQAAMRYQHTASDRLRILAERMAEHSATGL